MCESNTTRLDRTNLLRWKLATIFRVLSAFHAMPSGNALITTGPKTEDTLALNVELEFELFVLYC